MEEKTAKQKANEKYRLSHKEYFSNYYKKYYKTHGRKNYAKIYKDRLDKIIELLNDTEMHDFNYLEIRKETLKIARGEHDE